MRSRSALKGVVTVLVGLVALLMLPTVVLVSAAPASAAAPYQPVHPLLNCSMAPDNTKPACVTILAAPTCVGNNAACFAKSEAASSGRKVWWAQTLNYNICEGADAECLAAGGSSDATWRLDHEGSDPEPPSTEWNTAPAAPTAPVVNNDPNGPAKIWKSGDRTITKTNSGDCFSTTPGSIDPGGLLEKVDCDKYPPDATGCNILVNDFNSCSIKGLTNGLEFYALLLAVGGIMFSSLLWAVGSKGQNPGQELTGKRGIILCCACAFVIGAVPTILTTLDTQANKADTSGLNSVVNPGESGPTTTLDPNRNATPNGAPCTVDPTISGCATTTTTIKVNA